LKRKLKAPKILKLFAFDTPGSAVGDIDTIEYAGGIVGQQKRYVLNCRISKAVFEGPVEPTNPALWMLAKMIAT
jgi:hypothetical protein